MGHAFGLYHVFRGIEEIAKINGVCDSCYEKTASNYNGDFCEDTDPLPAQWDCTVPDIYENPDLCFPDRENWKSNSLKNLMGYTSCRESFTKQQERRMRCWQNYFKNTFS